MRERRPPCRPPRSRNWPMRSSGCAASRTAQHHVAAHPMRQRHFANRVREGRLFGRPRPERRAESVHGRVQPDGLQHPGQVVAHGSAGFSTRKGTRGRSRPGRPGREAPVQPPGWPQRGRTTVPGALCPSSSWRLGPSTSARQGRPRPRLRAGLRWTGPRSAPHRSKDGRSKPWPIIPQSSGSFSTCFPDMNSTPRLDSTRRARDSA